MIDLSFNDLTYKEIVYILKGLKEALVNHGVEIHYVFEDSDLNLPKHVYLSDIMSDPDDIGD